MARRHAAQSANRMVIIAITLVTAVFLLLMLYVFSGSTPVATQATPTLAVTQQNTALAANTTLAERDSDNDGLADWEEILWNTDPNNPDTDGDGVEDGEERAAGRNPTQPGAGLLANEVRDITDASTGDTGPKTVTNMVARELMGSAMETFQKTGGNVTVSSENVIAQNIEDELAKVASLPSYDKSLVRVVLSTDETRKRYIETVRTILHNTYEQAPGENLALSTLVNGDLETAIEQMQQTIAVYNSSIQGLKQTQVPKDALNIHHALVEQFMQFTATLEQFVLLNDDPILGAFATGQFSTRQQQLIGAAATFIAYSMQQTPQAATAPDADTTAAYQAASDDSGDAQQDSGSDAANQQGEHVDEPEAESMLAP